MKQINKNVYILGKKLLIHIHLQKVINVSIEITNIVKYLQIVKTEKM